MKYFLIAGEASGDLHASHLIKELKIHDSNAEFQFFGGDLMAAQSGKKPLKHYREMAFMGIINVLKNSKTVLQNLEDCKKAILKFKPDTVILIDYPSFNLRIARFVKENLKMPVFYYISPKIWAWKEFRVKQIKKYIDGMFTILPFETDFYKKHNYEVTYVGNPTVDSIYYRPNKNQTFSEFIEKNNLIDKPIVALLAGSRRQEIRSCLPKMIQMANYFSEYQFVISGAPGISESFYLQFLQGKTLPIVFNQTYELLSHSSAAVVNSGTATLETALLNIPQVVVYHVSFGRIAMILKKLFIKVKYVSLVNIIAGREVVKELLAHHFTEKNLQKELFSLLNDKQYISEIKENYAEIKNILGEKGAAERAAEGILEILLSSKKITK